MALGWNTLRSLPRLRTYKDADERERNTTPIKGDKQGLKPLGQRSMKFRHIKREANGDIGLYETSQPGYLPIMTFHPDDTVTVRTSPYWLKATGHDMVQSVMGLRIWTEAHDSWVQCEGGSFKLRPQPRMTWNSETQTYNPPEGADLAINRFKWEPYEGKPLVNGRWVYLNPLKPQVHVINRKGAKAVRERYAAFSQYLSAMSKLRRDNAPSFEEYVEAFGVAGGYEPSGMNYKPWWAIKLQQVGSPNFKHEQASELCQLMASNNPENQYRAFLWLTFREWGGTNAAKAMDRALLMHHHDEMLKIKEREHGEKAIDRYEWAIPA